MALTVLSVLGTFGFLVLAVLAASDSPGTAIAVLTCVFFVSMGMSLSISAFQGTCRHFRARGGYR